MAEAHQPFATFQLGKDYSFSPIRLSDLKDHIEGRPRSAAVKRSFESADGARHGGNDVGARRNNDARGKGRSVEAVIANRVQIGFQAARAFGPDFAAENLTQV